MHADIDLGLGVWVKNEIIRFARIDAPELRKPEREAGLEARNRVRELLPEGTEFFIQTIKDKKGKYGRYIGEIWLKGDNAVYRNVNDLLVDEGFAEYRNY